MLVKSESENFVVDIDGFGIRSDTTSDKGGTGRYIRPHELLSSCMNMTIRMAARSKGIHLADVRVSVDLDRSKPGTAIFNYKIEITPEDQTSTEMMTYLHEVAARCPVKKTLSGNLEFHET